MGSIFEKLLSKLNSVLLDLEFGNTIDEKELVEMWDLLHVLHFASFEQSSGKELSKILDYYGE